MQGNFFIDDRTEEVIPRSIFKTPQSCCFCNNCLTTEEEQVLKVCIRCQGKQKSSLIKNYNIQEIRGDI